MRARAAPPLGLVFVAQAFGAIDREPPGGRPALSLPARVGPRELGLLGQLATSFVLLARAAPLLLVFSIVLFRQHGDVAGKRRQLVNAGLVLVVAQGLQVLTVAVVLGA